MTTRSAGPRPKNYQAPAVNKKLIKPVDPDPKPDELRPKNMAWREVDRGDWPHMEPTICCDQKCRINDVVILFPVKQLNKITGYVFVHVGCLRSFLAEVPDEMSVVKERVSLIKDLFILE